MRGGGRRGRGPVRGGWGGVGVEGGGGGGKRRGGIAGRGSPLFDTSSSLVWEAQRINLAVSSGQ